MKINTLTFTEMLCSLLKSGLSLQSALQLAPEIVTLKKEKYFCSELYQKVSEGKNLSEALLCYENMFSQLYLSFIAIGEQSGTLCEVFEKLIDYLKEKKETKERIIQSLVYPIIVLSTALILMFVILFFVFPNLQGIFDAFGEASIELQNRIFKIITNIKISSFIFVVFLLAITLVAILYKLNFTTKSIIDSILLKTPFIGKQIIFSQTHDFAFSMKLLCSSYYPFDESLLISSTVLSNEQYKKTIKNVYSKIKNGNNIGITFEQEKLFPSYFVSWIKMAEINGNIYQAFSQIYEYFKKENTKTATRMSVILEPVFILITGIIVISIIIQFVIPIFKLMGAL